MAAASALAPTDHVNSAVNTDYPYPHILRRREREANDAAPKRPAPSVAAGGDVSPKRSLRWKLLEQLVHRVSDPLRALLSGGRVVEHAGGNTVPD
jgi:hypothetical protein